MLLILAAVGCAPAEFWRLESGKPKARESEAEREIRDWQRKVEQPSPQPPAERTGNVVVAVQRIMVAEQDRTRLAGAWKYTDDRVTVKGGDWAQSNGVRIGVAAGDFTGALSAALDRIRNRQVEKLSITVLSGRTGMIGVGQDTYVEALWYWTPRGRVVLFEGAFVGASLVVEPTILPEDRVQVRLYPRFTARSGRSIELTEMATEVVLRHGQSMVLGELDSSLDSVGFALFSWTQASERRKVTVILTPFIEGAP
jgi:hypothetical protein